VGLTPAQKAAGRRFRDQCAAELAALNASSPPDGSALAFWRVYRHDCPAAAGASVGIDLHEHYQLSPDRVLACLWKDGRCPDCGLVVRSGTVRVVIAADRPPAEVRAVGGQAGTHPGDSRLARA
jgi:hypothetical protein